MCTLEALENILLGSDHEVEDSSDSSVDFEVEEDEELLQDPFHDSCIFTARRRKDHLALNGPSLPLLGLRLYLLLQVTMVHR
ncbi:hypothetical protein AMECASPLE_038111 [Ameca splendens]|uniref:Uncharacterized protein n=1 Tax=Ameca splendens TaxID=208324 RepID=A0ABV0Y804_9TELE